MDELLLVVWFIVCWLLCSALVVKTLAFMVDSARVARALLDLAKLRASERGKTTAYVLGVYDLSSDAGDGASAPLQSDGGVNGQEEVC